MSLHLKCCSLQDEGAHNINFVSPSHMVFQMADAIRVAKGKGLAVPVVYNSNGYDSVDALRRIRGLVDIYLPDIKYLEHWTWKAVFSGGRLCGCRSRGSQRMLDQVGHLEMDR